MSDVFIARFEELRKTDKQWKSKTVAQKHAKHAEAAQEVMGPVTDAVVTLLPRFGRTCHHTSAPPSGASPCMTFMYLKLCMRRRSRN